MVVGKNDLIKLKEMYSTLNIGLLMGLRIFSHYPRITNRMLCGSVNRYPTSQGSLWPSVFLFLCFLLYDFQISYSILDFT